MPSYNAALTFIDEKETRRYAGLQKSEFSPQFIQDACQEAQLLAKAKGAWEIYPYDQITGTILAPQPLQLAGEKIKTYLKQCTQVAVMAVTIGRQIEQSIDNHFANGQYTHATLLDAAGTTAVEMAADQVSEIISRDFEKSGCKVLPRFSPGYGDWNLTEQPAVLQLANGLTIGMTVTESCMLEPRKSITAIMGIKLNIKNTNLTAHKSCANCSQENCLARKEQ